MYTFELFADEIRYWISIAIAYRNSTIYTDLDRLALHLGRREIIVGYRSQFV